MSAFPLLPLSERAMCEVEAVTSVFEDSIAISSLAGQQDTKLTYTIDNECTVHINVPPEYPSGASLTYTIDLIKSNEKNRILQEELKVAMDLILKEHNEEEVLFNLIECIREKFEMATNLEFDDNSRDDDRSGNGPNEQWRGEDSLDDNGAESHVEIAASIQIFHGKPYVERKSTFIPHFAYVTNMDQVEAFKREIITDSKFSKATHNIFAYRYTCTERGIVVHDYDDDGETAAGGRLAEILRLMKVENHGVAVIVTRFYGGQLLGPDRFKIINSQARGLLKEHGVVK